MGIYKVNVLINITLITKIGHFPFHTYFTGYKNKDTNLWIEGGLLNVSHVSYVAIPLLTETLFRVTSKFRIWIYKTGVLKVKVRYRN